MQNIVLDTPYRFVPPVRNHRWGFLLAWYLPRYLRKNFGIEKFEYRGLEHLERSRAAEHAVILAPNHCRPEDPFTIGMLVRHIHMPVYFMAARHLFETGWFKRWMVRLLGAFSVHREGMDREAMNFAVDGLTHNRRTLVLFPEGTITRSNDRLIAMMDGVTLIARRAAAARAKLDPAKKVVIHPVALRYVFEGDWLKAIDGVLTDIEQRISWRPQPELPPLERICRVGKALLALKELEYFGEPQAGTIEERQDRLVERLFRPLEAEWLNGRRDPDVVQRVKRLRTEILAGMIAGKIDPAESSRRWNQLADIYLAQQIAFYPHGYLDGEPSIERMMETVERFEEDLTDVQRVHRPYRVIIQIGEPIEVSPERERRDSGESTMDRVRTALEAMLDSLTREVAQERIKGGQ